MGEPSNSLYILKETKNPALGRNQTSVAQSQPVTTPSVSHATNVNLLTSFTNCNAYNDINAILLRNKTLFCTLEFSV